MRKIGESMGWLDFAHYMSEKAHELAGSNGPMVFVLPDGREIRFSGIDVHFLDFPNRRGDTEFTDTGFRINLIDAEIRKKENHEES